LLAGSLGFKSDNDSSLIAIGVAFYDILLTAALKLDRYIFKFISSL
jgi:hypothetical protein